MRVSKWDGSYLISKLFADTGYVQRDNQIYAGSTTSCNLTLSPEGILKAANLGDSTFAVLRKGVIHHFQPAQTHCKPLSRYEEC